MSALPYMPLYVADYLADTAHLTALENGAYLMLIMNYWQRGKAIPSGDISLSRIAKVSLKEWAGIRDNVASFFEVEGDTWVHQRIENELEKVRDKSIKASSAGKASAQQKVNRRSTGVEQTFNHTDTDTDTDRINHLPLTPEPTPDAFEAADDQLRKISGLEKHPVFTNPDISPLWQLHLTGLDFKTQIIPKIKIALQRAKPGTIRSWGYFAKLINETAAQPITISVDWQKRLATARTMKSWDYQHYGPPPHTAGCLVPRELLLPDDGVGWAKWAA